MIALFVLHLLLFTAFPYYMTRLDSPYRQVSFYMYLAVVLFMGGMLGSVYSMQLAPDIIISGGMLTYGAFMMASMIFVIVERDLFILRHIVRLLITVDIFNFLLNSLIVATLQHPDTINLNHTQVAIFSNSAYIILVGGVLILVELFLLIYIFEGIKKISEKVTWTTALYLLSFTAVLCLDSFLFPLLVFGINPNLTNFIHDNILSKLVLAVSFSVGFGLVLLLNHQRLKHYIQSPALSWRVLITSTTKLQQDITEKERKLRQAAAVFDSTNEGIVVSNAEFYCSDSNYAFKQMTGLASSQLAQTNLLELMQLPPSNKHTIQQHIAQHQYWEQEVRFLHCQTQEPQYGLLSVSALTTERNIVSGYVGALTNINELKHTQQQLRYNALHDSLTGLPNRQVLLDELEMQVNSESQPVCQSALLILDLDNFKDVNDSYTHLAGDEILLHVARALQSLTAPQLLVCRIGGDEFALYLKHYAHADDISQLLLALQQAVKGPWCLSNGINIHLSASVGISLYPGHAGSADELIQQADSALYNAKRQRKGSSLYFDESMILAVRHKLDIEGRLRECLKQGGLQVYFQPKISVKTGDMVGAEALVRWFDPEKGYIAPDAFIPLAEETGLIESIGNFVLSYSCQQGKQWLEQGHKIQIAVNVSAYQLRFGQLVATVQQVLQDTGFPASLLELEITETALMEKEQEALPILKQLRKLGVQLAIDDFGTGYSSLAYLKNFPINTLKIDKSFIDGIPNVMDDVELTSTIIAMGQNLGFQVVAEGVETMEQLVMLRFKGCDIYQGYLNSPAVNVQTFTEMLNSKI